MRCSVCHTLNA
ncbi:hypothetical protein FH508_0018470 [Lysinibacillus sp. CD3-6]|nr:hypothetical protein FH508_0018470 [Lysinibacillus sp. CD3-6]